MSPPNVLADKGDDRRALVEHIEAMGAKAVIPARSCQRHRAFDSKIYRARNAIERCFGRLQQWRSLATRHDRKDSNFQAFLLLERYHDQMLSHDPMPDTASFSSLRRLQRALQDQHG